MLTKEGLSTIIEAIKTAGAEVAEIKMSPSERVFQKLWRPEVMFVLMLIAIYGIIGELSNPGAILPGVVGAIAVAPSDPNVVYVGMGEACIRGNVSHGDGVYRSTDAGLTWTEAELPPRFPPVPGAEEMLADLRVEIDRIDAAMHKLLIERSDIINTLRDNKVRFDEIALIFGGELEIDFVGDDDEEVQ